MNATYLGDGLYVDFDGYQIRLYTPQGNEVYLEPDVLNNFLRYVKELNERLAQN